MLHPIPLLHGGSGALLVGLSDQRHAMAMLALSTARASAVAIGLIVLTKNNCK